MHKIQTKWLLKITSAMVWIQFSVPEELMYWKLGSPVWQRYEMRSGPSEKSSSAPPHPDILFHHAISLSLKPPPWIVMPSTMK